MARADYEAQGTALSTNLLSGASDVAQITNFTATVTIVAGTTVGVQFSQDQDKWYDKNGIEGAYDALADGANTIELRALNWTTANFYYRLQFTTTDSANTATVSDISVNYTDTYTPWTPPWGNGYHSEGAALSTNLFQGLGDVAQIKNFHATVTIPANATLGVQFSQDQILWYDQNGIEGGYTLLSDGSNAIELRALNWTGANFYYRAHFTSTDAGATATLSEIEAEYNTVWIDYTPAWNEGSVPSGAFISIDLLADSGGRTLSGYERFGYKISELPSGATVKVQFSRNGTDWYSSDGTLWGTDTLKNGTYLDERNSLDLTKLAWGGATSFYYKLELTAGSSGGTPIVTDAGLVEPVVGQPVGYWSFDEGQGATAHDESQNKNNGTITGATWKPESECVSGKCLAFNGTSDYVDMGNNSTLDMTGNFTLSLWFNSKSWSSGSAYKTLMSKRDEYGSMDWEWFYNSGDSAIEFWFGSAGVNPLYFSLGVNPSINQWHHITLTRSGNNFEMYLDGVNKGTDSSSASIPTGDKVRIGAWFGSGVVSADSLFNGLIDEPKIYPYARTADQIKQDYNAGLAGMGQAKTGASATFGGSSDKWLTDGLVGYWKMDEASWNGTSGEVIDASGNGNNGTSAGGATTAGGKYGNGGSFDGVDNHINMAKKVIGVDTVTACSWINPPSGYQVGSIVDNYDFIFTINVQNNPFERVELSSNYGTTFVTSAQHSIVFDTWQHVCVVRMSDGKATFYINGVQSGATDQNSGVPTNAYNYNESIGARPDGIGPVNSQIDETRIYNRALSPDEIKKLYEWAPGPVLHLKMDEKVQGDGKTLADDSTYGNNGTTHYGANTTGMDCTTPGKFGSACNFDGVDDLINCGNGSSLQSTGTVSASMWINSSHTGWNLFAKKQLYNDNGWWFGTTTLGRLYLFIFSGGTLRAQNAPTVVTDGKWHFVSATYDGYKVIYYVDGVNTYTYDWGSYLPIGNTNDDLYVASGPYEDPFLGLIDDVRIYNYARTQEQILADYASGSDGQGKISPIAHYNFNEGYGSVAHNEGYGGASLAGNLGVGSSAPTWTNDGKNGKALSFDGVDDYVSVADPADGSLDFGSQSFTLSAWVKTSATGYDRIISKGHYGWIDGYMLQTYTGSGKISTGIGAGGVQANALTFYSSTEVNDNNWHHVMSVFNQETKEARIYIDGVADSLTKVSSTCGTVSGTVIDFSSCTSVSASSANSLVVGRYDGSSAEYFNGLIDDVKIYSYALTEDEIKTDYNSGYSAVVGSSGTTSAGAPSNSDSREYCVPGDTATCNPPVSEWLMDEKVSGDAKTLNDTSGNGNNGTTNDGANNTGMDCTQPGKVGKACTFDGVDDYINSGSASTVDDIQTSGTGMTISMWANARGSVNQPALISKGTINDNGFWILFLDGEAYPGLRFIKDFGTAGYGQDLNVVTDFYNLNYKNNWKYIVMTWDGTSLASGVKFYIDGSQRANTTNENGTGSAVADSALNLYLGSAIASNSTNGILDNVKIYNYARTPAQIAWEYNQGRPVAEWRMNECQGTAIHDDSGNGNTGTLNLGASGQTTAGTCSANANTPWYNGRTGKYGGSLNFDGVDDYVTASGSNLPIGFAPRTMSLWFNRTADQNYTEALAWYGETGYAGIFGIAINDSDYLGVISYGDDYYPTSPGTQSLNTWTHVVAIYDGVNVYLYKNGEFVASEAKYWNLHAGDVSIGSMNPSYPFSGQIDEVKIFNYALTPTQIQQLYNNSSALNFGN